jgi:hypothetical protein
MLYGPSVLLGNGKWVIAGVEEPPTAAAKR